MAYIKETFDASSMDHAKHIVLTSDPNDPTKFEDETVYLMKLIDDLKLVDNKFVVDFGCGMGRVSKELLARGARVIGVDISPSMLALAKEYVGNHKEFTAVSKFTFNDVVDVYICIFSLQHTENPIKEIENIARSLKKGGHIILVNENIRFVPSGIDKNRFVIWNDDGINIREELGKRFKEVSSIPYRPRENSTLDFVVFRKE